MNQVMVLLLFSFRLMLLAAHFLTCMKQCNNLTLTYAREKMQFQVFFFCSFKLETLTKCVGSEVKVTKQVKVCRASDIFGASKLYLSCQVSLVSTPMAFLPFLSAIFLAFAFTSYSQSTIVSIFKFNKYVFV